MYYLWVHVCLHIFMSVETASRYQIPWNCNDRQIWTTRNEWCSFLNEWVIFLEPRFSLFKLYTTALHISIPLRYIGRKTTESKMWKKITHICITLSNCYFKTFLLSCIKNKWQIYYNCVRYLISKVSCWPNCWLLYNSFVNFNSTIF